MSSSDLSGEEQCQIEIVDQRSAPLTFHLLSASSVLQEGACYLYFDALHYIMRSVCYKLNGMKIFSALVNINYAIKG